ncbi:MAG: HTH-type transcriptional activator IlvY [Gammaproteobacteria bacterium]|nr:HTH-type transcriptional activator IlvY [Gammaproteobacteria bacterium]
MYPDLNQLRLFCSLADNLHFGRTSETNNMSPSALSRSIARLEAQMGVGLLMRDNRSVQLTAQGQLLQEFARRLLQEWDEFQPHLSEGSSRMSGRLTIYASVTASQSILPQVLGRFRRKYPDIHIQLETGYAVNAIQHLKQGADVVVAALPEKRDDQLVQHVLAKSAVITIAPRENPDIGKALAGNKTDWSSIPLIMPSEGQVRDDVEHWFSRKQIRPFIYSEVAGNEAILSLVALGCGIGFVPSLVLDASPLAKQVQAVSSGPSFSGFSIGFCVLRKSLSRHPLIQVFWEELGAAEEG